MSDPSDPLPVIDYRHPRLRKVRRVRSFDEETLKLAGLATAFIGHALVANPEKPVEFFFIFGGAIWFAVLWATLSRRVLFPTMLRQPVAAWLTRLGLIVAVLQATFMPYTYSCPHADRRANNFFGIARSSMGGPCRNGGYSPSSVWHVYGDRYIFLVDPSAR